MSAAFAAALASLAAAPPPRTCNGSLTLQNIALSSDTLMSFAAIDSPIACCDLCSVVEGCVAFTLVDGRCDLKDWATPLEALDGALSAFMHEFATEDGHHNPIVYSQMDGVTLSPAPLEVYPVDDKEACGVLCSKYGYAPEPGSGSGDPSSGDPGSGPEYSACTAFTVSEGSCNLYDSLAPMGPAKGVVGGSMPNAAAHYGNPSNGCLQDELKNSLGGIDGHFCSAPCRGPGPWKDKKWCPPEVPVDVTAKPSCMISDPVGYGFHCALSCSDDAQCGAGAVCNTQAYPGIGLCIFPPPSFPPPEPAPPTAMAVGGSERAGGDKPAASTKTPARDAKPPTTPTKPTEAAAPKELTNPKQGIASAMKTSLVDNFAKAAHGRVIKRF